MKTPNFNAGHFEMLKDHPFYSISERVVQLNLKGTNQTNDPHGNFKNNSS